VDRSKVDYREVASTILFVAAAYLLDQVPPLRHWLVGFSGLAVLAWAVWTV
jgi:hypothetical protein